MWSQPSQEGRQRARWQGQQRRRRPAGQRVQPLEGAHAVMLTQPDLQIALFSCLAPSTTRCSCDPNLICPGAAQSVAVAAAPARPAVAACGGCSRGAGHSGHPHAAARRSGHVPEGRWAAGVFVVWRAPLTTPAISHNAPAQSGQLHLRPCGHHALLFAPLHPTLPLCAPSLPHLLPRSCPRPGSQKMWCDMAAPPASIMTLPPGCRAAQVRVCGAGVVGVRGCKVAAGGPA